MKVEFELNIDEKTGEPIIRFRHDERSDAMEQRLLKIFVEKAKKNGILLVNPNGQISSGSAWENYEIKIK